jgi:hypothetical protein
MKNQSSANTVSIKLADAPNEHFSCEEGQKLLVETDQAGTLIITCVDVYTSIMASYHVPVWSRHYCAGSWVKVETENAK